MITFDYKEVPQPMTGDNPDQGTSPVGILSYMWTLASDGANPSERFHLMRYANIFGEYAQILAQHAVRIYGQNRTVTPTISMHGEDDCGHATIVGRINLVRGNWNLDTDDVREVRRNVAFFAWNVVQHHPTIIQKPLLTALVQEFLLLPAADAAHQLPSKLMRHNNGHVIYPAAWKIAKI